MADDKELLGEIQAQELQYSAEETSCVDDYAN